MSAKIPLAGVVGAPIAHSKSPKLHAHWLRTYGLPGHYIPMHIEREDLRRTLEFLPRMGFMGLNITIPYKEDVMQIADLVTDRAALIGAANTLIFRKDGKIHADNTDGYGFIENLKSGAPHWVPSAGPAVVLGAGGAARAVIMTLIEAGVPKIYLTNRNRARADALREEFGSKVVCVEWLKAGNIIDDAYLIVNTTSLGMVGQPDLRIPLDGLTADKIVTDLVYTPIKTPLLMAAEAAGATAVDGLGMLLHQAVPGFERWFGQKPVVDNATRHAVLGL